MKFVVKARSEAERLRFLRLVYEGKEYSCDELKMFVSENGLDFEKVLNGSIIKYSG